MGDLLPSFEANNRLRIAAYQITDMQSLLDKTPAPKAGQAFQLTLPVAVFQKGAQGTEIETLGVAGVGSPALGSLGAFDDASMACLSLAF